MTFENCVVIHLMGVHASPGQQHHHARQPLTVEILLILVPVFSATISDCFPSCQFYLWVSQIHSFLYFYCPSSVSSFSSRKLQQPCCLALLYSVPFFQAFFHITVDVFWVQMKKKSVCVCVRAHVRVRIWFWLWHSLIKLWWFPSTCRVL